MDLEQLNAMRSKYLAEKDILDTAKKQVEKSTKILEDADREFRKGLLDYLNANFARKWIKTTSCANTNTDFYKFAISFEWSHKGVCMYASQELDVCYKKMPPIVKHFRYSTLFPLTLDVVDCRCVDFSLDPVDEKEINAFLKLVEKPRDCYNG